MRRFLSSIPWLFLALGLAPLIAWAVLGFSTRYLADDYSTASFLAQKGFWPVQAFWYETWSGRYAFTFLVSLTELLGVGVVPLLALLALTLWFISLFWALKQSFQALSIPVAKLWLGVLAATIIFGSVKSIKDYTEVIFWQTGILTYQISLILFCLALGLFLKRFFSKPQMPAVALWEYPVAFLIALILGGFSETWIILQVAILTLALIYFSFFHQKPHRSDVVHMLLAAYIGSWCAFLAIVKSPGNAGRTVRMTQLSLETLFGAMFAAIRDVPLFLAQWLTGNTAMAVGLLLAGAVTGFLTASANGERVASQGKHLLRSGMLLTVAIGLLSVGFFPAFVVWGTRPVDRAAFLPIFLFILAFILFGFFAGRFLAGLAQPGKRQTAIQLTLTMLLALTMFWLQGRATISAVQLLPTLQTYARLWDERDAFLRAARTQKKGNIVVSSVRRNPNLHDIRDTIWDVGELSEDPRDWINQVAAAYYGVKSISGK